MSPRGNIILWLVATVVVAALTALAVTRRVPASKSLPDASIHAASGLSLHEWMHQHLEITASQHAVLDPLETGFEAESLLLRQRVRQLGSELALAIRDGVPGSVVLATQEKLNTAQGQLQQATLNHFLAMKQHLTPAQAAKLATWTHDSILNQPGH